MTTIDLGNGMTITTAPNSGFGHSTTGGLVDQGIAGPQPMQAASPPPPPPPTKAGPPKGGPPSSNGGPDEATEGATLDSLDKRVSALEDAMNQVIQMLQQAASAQVAAIERAAPRLPPEDASPKV